MAMVSVVNCQPTGGLMVQADWLGPKVGGHLAPCCIHHMKQGELSQCCFKHNDSTINIALVLILSLNSSWCVSLAPSHQSWAEHQSAQMSKVTNDGPIYHRMLYRQKVGIKGLTFF